MTRSFILLVFLLACSGDDGVDVSSRDPRCVSACTSSEPPHEGIGRVCDTASFAQCLDECEARLAGVAPICQNCLVERACLEPGGCALNTDPVPTCMNDLCTVETQFGSCMFAREDQAARLECYRQVDPRREVTCIPTFRPATECASVCI